MSGYEKLKSSVEGDCNDRDECGCFNPNGCDVPRQREDDKRCFHAYCDKFKWTVDRAKHYGEKLGLNWEDILTSWEADREYWYMNYYQDSNQPEITSERVRVFENVDDLMQAIGERKFRCPICEGISTDPYECNSGVVIHDKVCDWKVYGLFRDAGKGMFVYVKEKLRGQLIFMPVSWEKEVA